MLRFLLISIVVIALFLHNLPYLVRDQAVIWLLNNGAETAQLKAIKVDWFAGEVEVQALVATAQGKPDLRLETLRVDLDYASLMDKRLLLSRVMVKGVDAGIQQQADALWLGPIDLNRLQGEDGSQDDTQQSGAWSFGLAQLQLNRIDWRAELPGQQHRLQLTSGRLADLYLWDQQQSVTIDLDGVLNGAPIKLSSNSKPLPQEKSSELQIKLDNFPVHSVTALFLPELRATVDLDLKISAKSDLAAKNTQLRQSGSVRVRDFSFKREQLDIQQQQLSWSGDVDLALKGSELSRLTARNHIKSGIFALALPDTQLQTGTLDLQAELKMQGLSRIEVNNAQLGIQQIALAQGGKQIKAAELNTTIALSTPDLQQWQVSAPQIKLAETSVSSNKPLITLKAAELSNLQMQHTDNIAFARLDLQGLAVMGEGSPFSQWQSIAVKEAVLSRLQQLNLKQIELRNSSTRIQLSEKRQLTDLEWLLGQLQSETQNVSTAPQADRAAQPFNVQLGQVLLHGENKLDLIDGGVNPAYKTAFDISRLELNDLDTASKGKTKFLLNAKNKFSTLAAEGDLALFSGSYDGNWQIDIKGFELPQVSPYSLQYTGYYMHSGQLSVSSEGTIKDRVLKGDSDIRLNKLEVEARNAQRSGEFDQKVSMPLGTAIMVLQDNDNNIDLQIPIDGSLDDPQFGYQTVINKLAGKGLKSAAMGYLTKALQPFGTLISIGKMVVDAQSKGTFISLQPVYFTPGQSALTAESQQYLSKIAQMMNERKAMRITLCGQAVLQDKDPLWTRMQDQNKKKEKPLSEEQLVATLDAELNLLAEARSDQVKGMLTDKLGIDTERLFSCYPNVDLSSDDKPSTLLGL